MRLNVKFVVVPADDAEALRRELLRLTDDVTRGVNDTEVLVQRVGQLATLARKLQESATPLVVGLNVDVTAEP